MANFRLSIPGRDVANEFYNIYMMPNTSETKTKLKKGWSWEQTFGKTINPCFPEAIEPARPRAARPVSRDLSRPAPDGRARCRQNDGEGARIRQYLPRLAMADSSYSGFPELNEPADGGPARAGRRRVGRPRSDRRIEARSDPAATFTNLATGAHTVSNENLMKKRGEANDRKDAFSL
jgi:hypothetical protein